jgi:ribosome assembly protein 4
MALSSDYVLRLGPFDHAGRPLIAGADLSTDQGREQLREAAQLRYDQLIKAGPERLVTGSDDFTLFLWSPTVSKAPLTRMTGHQNLINHVAFSPSTDYIASASFDKSIKLWNGTTGKFICNLRAHVGCVYWCAWSADSRLLVSASKDSTLKLWDVRTGKMVEDLPGHADEVFTVDWTASGESRVISGGRDRMIKFWRQ